MADAGSPDVAVSDGGGSDTAGDASLQPAIAACTPGVTIPTAAAGSSRVWCGDGGTSLGVPNGAAVYGETVVLPSPLIAGADNAFSFQLTGWGPFNFELWGTNTVCKAEELLWWGTFGAGTQCAQFRPSKAFANLLYVARKMYSVSYSFGQPASTMCPGGTCPAGTTGTGKVSDAPLSAPVGNYQLNRFRRLTGGWDITLGRSGRMTVAWQGNLKDAGVAQPLAAGVFRLPTTDPYGDAWYCIGEGSTLTQIEKDGAFKGVQFSLRGVTRLGDCGETPGSGSLSATIYPSSTSGTDAAADITGSISSWTGSNLSADPDCTGAFCNFRFRGSPQEHFVHVTTTSTDLAAGTTAPIPVTGATWLVQPSSTQPFSMACSSEGTLDYRPNETSKLQLAKVTGPRACPGTPLSNDCLDLTADF